MRTRMQPPYARLGAAAAGGATRQMQPWQHLSVFALSLVGFVLLDGLWIGVVAADFYQAALRPVLKPDVDVLAAALSWLCIVAVNQCFVLPKTTSAGPCSAFYVLGQGALLGLLLYGTVDMTCCALVQHWSWPVALVDVAWGTVACALLAVIQNKLSGWLMACGAAA